MIPLAHPQPMAAPDPLVQRCVDGDEYAWSSLYAAYESSARSFLSRLGVGPEALDDACQEVFLEAFRHLPRFRGDCSFRTWLYRLCATQARKVRQRARVRRALRSVLSVQNTNTWTKGEWNERRAGQLVERGLDTLTEPERLVFVLYEFEAMAGREISEIAECPEATVWRRLHYARKKFRKVIEEQGGTP